MPQHRPRRRSGSPVATLAYRVALPLPPSTLVGLAAAVLAVILMALAAGQSDQERSVAAANVTHTFQVVDQLRVVLSTVKDAETGQRGYLLTGDERYLEPWLSAKSRVDVEVAKLRTLIGDNAGQQERFDGAASLITEKIAELSRTVELRRAGQTDAALAIVDTDQGKIAMDRLRAVVAEMDAEEQKLLSARQERAREAAAYASRVTWVGSALLLLLISGTAYLLSRDHRARETERWLKEGQTGVAGELQGERTLEDLGDRATRFLSEYMGALVGTVYASDEVGRFRRIAALGLPESNDAGAAARPGDGLLGEAIKAGRTIHVRDVPAGYLTVSSSVGRAEPRSLVVAPLDTDGVVVGAIELGFFRAVQPVDLELLERVSEPVAFALASSKYKARLATLLEESQRQAEELQTQQTEMEAQQAELEASNEELNQTNAMMEVQTTELAQQRDDLAQAREVADKTSRYKSEFLANMSHELRTPLNSSLILARLLADNQEGNLTPDQIRSAETILSAGNDLLVLINDILDLSKIEAGRADIVMETVVLDRIADSLERSFRPVADQRGVEFRVTRNDRAIPQITTDGRRLEQVLKNLLSNAFKFTERGEVELILAVAGPDVRFAVRDTGIGIAPHQKDVIFEAFRQADGTTSRKYGGTGLGLSISRELARLLGGELTVDSTFGVGSTFTLTLPRDGVTVVAARASMIEAALPVERGRPLTPEPVPRQSAQATNGKHAASAFSDDRDALARRGRLILVVEDDAVFARVLFDLAHELDLDCVVAGSADDGIRLARDLRPIGILLDVGLPDASGLSVLERLKRDSATRHIPIHVVSGVDNAQTALELGAIGYALKPVARDDLVAALKKLQERHTREVRRVLIVEDDVRQQESIEKLLRGQGVELVLAGSVKEALAELDRRSVDCMVLDLTLPDGSGHDLLEKMAEGTRYSFPPVIVYTGRDLDRSDEERLRRYSRSIIVKGARSPERLLDEVTLFLHQVESTLPAEQRRLLADARQREAVFEGRRILVVEDDVRNVFALSRVLEPRGAKVEIARNGREALHTLDRVSDVDLVLMDLMMPEMDGLTAIRELRKKDKFKRLPIIALTAKAMPDDREQAIGAGANDYMAKPFDVDKLISLCRVWLPR